MLDYTRHILIGQFEAALTMLKQCIEACPAEHWESKIANGTFRWVTYHTLFYTDLYLTSDEKAFEPRELNHRGGDERQPHPAAGLSKDDSLSYVAICRQKAVDSISAETDDALQGPSGFSWYKCSRGELHLINIRHIQHHAAQLSAFLRRATLDCKDRSALPWVASGWQ